MAKKHGKSNKKANKSKKKKSNSNPCQNQGLSSERNLTQQRFSLLFQ